MTFLFLERRNYEKTDQNKIANNFIFFKVKFWKETNTILWTRKDTDT